MTPFDHFSHDALTFLEGLKANNTRDWFSNNKSTYEKQVRDPAKQFAKDMSTSLQDLTGHPHHAKIYRINRDVRFSKDKTPYNAHLHISFQPDMAVDTPPMWFFGVSPDGLTVGCGVFEYPKGDLDRFRSRMIGSDGDELMALINLLRSKGCRIADPALKRVPQGYDKDHPHAEVLRRKGFSAWRDLGNPAQIAQPNLIARMIDALRPLMPVFQFLSRP